MEQIISAMQLKHAQARSGLQVKNKPGPPGRSKLQRCSRQ